MVKLYFSFYKWWNGETSICCNGDMVKLYNGESFFLGKYFHRWKNGEMVKKINNKMNSMVRLNYCVGYQLFFSLLDFRTARQWWPSWKVWGISHMLYMVSAGLPPILSCHLSIFLMVKWCNGEMIRDGAAMMVRLFCCGNSICALEWIFPRENCPGQKIVVGENSVLSGKNPGGHVVGDGPRIFRFLGQLLKTLDTQLGRKL